MVKPSPVRTFVGPDVCGYCGFPVAWDESAQQGTSWNPPSVNARRVLTHAECDDDAFTLRMWGHYIDRDHGKFPPGERAWLEANRR